MSCLVAGRDPFNCHAGNQSKILLWEIEGMAEGWCYWWGEEGQRARTTQSRF